MTSLSLEHKILGRPMVASLSTDNLAHNVRVIRRWAPNSSIIAMVKSNGYGHGIRSVSKRLQGLVECLGVASINEALALRESGVDAKIVLMEGVFSPHEYAYAAMHGFVVVLHNQLQLRWLQEVDCGQVQVWLKVDTGMARLGFSMCEAQQAYTELLQSPKVSGKVGLMSHFACAADKNHPLNVLQMQRFSQLRTKMSGPSSFCNSAGLLHFPDMQGDVVRPGLALYGVSPVHGKYANEFDLKAVMTLRSAVIAIRDVRQGESIGYNATFVCQKPMRIAVVACGYGDGYPQMAPAGTPVIINKHRCRLVGRVSMDMMSVDITDHPDINLGSEATLWGEELPVEEVAQSTARSPYELLTGVQHRVQFTWEDGV